MALLSAMIIFMCPKTLPNIVQKYWRASLLLLRFNFVSLPNLPSRSNAASEREREKLCRSRALDLREIFYHYCSQALEKVRMVLQVILRMSEGQANEGPSEPQLFVRYLHNYAVATVQIYLSLFGPLLADALKAGRR